MISFFCSFFLLRWDVELSLLSQRLREGIPNVGLERHYFPYRSIGDSLNIVLEEETALRMHERKISARKNSKRDPTKGRRQQGVQFGF